MFRIASTISFFVIVVLIDQTNADLQHGFLTGGDHVLMTSNRNINDGLDE